MAKRNQTEVEIEPQIEVWPLCSSVPSGGGGGGTGEFDLTSLPPSILNSGCHIFWLTNLKKMVGRIVKIFEKPPPKKISAHATASLVYFLSAVIIAFVGDEIILAY